IYTIERGRKRKTDRQSGRMVILNIKYSPGKSDEGVVLESLQNRCPARVLIVGRGIDARRGSKWIENDRNIGLRRSSYIRAYPTIVEIQRVGEKVRLSRVIAVKGKDEIAHRLVSVRDPRGSRNRVVVKKPRIGDPVNRCLVNSTIVETVDI